MMSDAEVWLHEDREQAVLGGEGREPGASSRVISMKPLPRVCDRQQVACL